ncbi:MAG: DoxX family protein [Proteobacteria bacterium]|nr:DoxX family protein [Pseudomonadota bacterium]
MKIAYTIILAILTFLAISAGITKVVLMQQDVDFFGRYGFSDPILIAYGVVQLIGGVLLPFNKTRFVGAAIVAITFLVSLVVLLMDGNIPVSIVTIVMTLLLGVVMKQSRKTAPSELLG